MQKGARAALNMKGAAELYKNYKIEKGAAARLRKVKKRSNRKVKKRSNRKVKKKGAAARLPQKII